MEIATDKADRCVMKAKVFERSMAWVWFSDIVWKPNVATFRYKRILHTP